MDLGMVMRATAMVRTKSMRIERLRLGRRGVPSTCTRALIGTLSGWTGRVARAWIRPTRSLCAFAHADNAAAADIDAGVAHMLQRVQPVLIGPGADDVAVIFRRGVEIVVVIIQPRLFQPRRLRRRSACPG